MEQDGDGEEQEKERERRYERLRNSSSPAEREEILASLGLDQRRVRPEENVEDLLKGLDPDLQALVLKHYVNDDMLDALPLEQLDALSKLSTDVRELVYPAIQRRAARSVQQELAALRDEPPGSPPAKVLTQVSVRPHGTAEPIATNVLLYAGARSIYIIKAPQQVGDLMAAGKHFDVFLRDGTLALSDARCTHQVPDDLRLDEYGEYEPKSMVDKNPSTESGVIIYLSAEPENVNQSVFP